MKQKTCIIYEQYSFQVDDAQKSCNPFFILGFCFVSWERIVANNHIKNNVVAYWILVFNKKDTQKAELLEKEVNVRAYNKVKTV